MHATETPQQRLSRRVRTRRQELGLSVRAASKLAGVDRNTWASLEDGSRVTQDRHYGGIERTLQWPTGHILALLEKDLTPENQPTDEQIIAMTARTMATHYVKLDREFGKESADDWMFHALVVRRDARRAARGFLATEGS